MEIAFTIDVEIPKVPLHVKETGGKRASISITDFTPAALREIAVEWTKALMVAAGHEESDAYEPDMRAIPNIEGTVES